MQKVEERSECEHAREKQEIKGIQFQSWNISIDYLSCAVCVSSFTRAINYIDAMHSIFYYSSFIKRIANYIRKYLNGNKLREMMLYRFFGRHKKCSTRQTITLIDGCTAVNYVTNNVFQRRLSFFSFNNRSNIKVFCWKNNWFIGETWAWWRFWDKKKKSQINVQTTSWGLPLSLKTTGILLLFMRLSLTSLSFENYLRQMAWL